MHDLVDGLHLVEAVRLERERGRVPDRLFEGGGDVLLRELGLLQLEHDELAARRAAAGARQDVHVARGGVTASVDDRRRLGREPEGHHGLQVGDLAVAGLRASQPVDELQLYLELRRASRQVVVTGGDEHAQESGVLGVARPLHRLIGGDDPMVGNSMPLRTITSGDRLPSGKNFRFATWWPSTSSFSESDSLAFIIRLWSIVKRTPSRDRRGQLTPGHLSRASASRAIVLRRCLIFASPAINSSSRTRLIISWAVGIGPFKHPTSTVGLSLDTRKELRESIAREGMDRHHATGPDRIDEASQVGKARGRPLIQAGLLTSTARPANC